MTDLLDHPVGKVFLLWVATQIGEGQHSDRRFVGEQEGRRRPALGGETNFSHPIDPNRRAMF